jgi:hypothetical protein
MIGKHQMVIGLLWVCFLGFLSLPGMADPTFLWKPVSESDGKLVVLFPSQYSLSSVDKVTIKGSFGVEQPGRALSVANGNRIHARFSKGGGSYGSNVSVILHFKSGGTRTWTVSDGSKRTTTTNAGVAAGSTDGSTGGESGSSEASLGELLGTKGADALISLSGESPGSKKVTISEAGIIKARVNLRTYGAASLKITVNGETWVSWSRSSDSDSSKCMESGKEVADSIFEENAGDPSAKDVSLTREVKAGDVVEGMIEGQDFRGEKAYVFVEQGAGSGAAATASGTASAGND